jgi:hypothetical protein
MIDHPVLHAIEDIKTAYRLTDRHVAHIFGTSDATIRRWRLGYNIPKWIVKSIEMFNDLSKKRRNEIIDETVDAI